MDRTSLGEFRRSHTHWLLRQPSCINLACPGGRATSIANLGHFLHYMVIGHVTGLPFSFITTPLFISGCGYQVAWPYVSHAEASSPDPASIRAIIDQPCAQTTADRLTSDGPIHWPQL